MQKEGLVRMFFLVEKSSTKGGNDEDRVMATSWGCFWPCCSKVTVTDSDQPSQIHSRLDIKQCELWIFQTLIQTLKGLL